MPASRLRRGPAHGLQTALRAVHPGHDRPSVCALPHLPVLPRRRSAPDDMLPGSPERRSFGTFASTAAGPSAGPWRFAADAEATGTDDAERLDRARAAGRRTGRHRSRATPRPGVSRLHPSPDHRLGGTTVTARAGQPLPRRPAGAARTAGPPAAPPARRRELTTPNSTDTKHRQGGAVQADVGDHIVIETAVLDAARRRGEGIEVIGQGEKQHYRVRGQDGPESGYVPGPGAR